MEHRWKCVIPLVPYKTYILPILEYSNLCVVYNTTQSDRLEKVQRKITRYICFRLGKSDLKYEERLKFLNLESLESRRKTQILKIVFRIKQNSPKIRTDWLNQLQFYETSRNGTYCKTTRNRISLSDKYIFNYSVVLFYSLPIFIRNEKCFNRFLMHLKQYF